MKRRLRFRALTEFLMRILCPLLLCGLAWLSVPVRAQEPGKLDVTVVKYDALKDIVLKNRGKVVVVDIWGFG